MAGVGERLCIAAWTSSFAAAVRLTGSSNPEHDLKTGVTAGLGAVEAFTAPRTCVRCSDGLTLPPVGFSRRSRAHRAQLSPRHPITGGLTRSVERCPAESTGEDIRRQLVRRTASARSTPPPWSAAPRPASTPR